MSRPTGAALRPILVPAKVFTGNRTACIELPRGLLEGERRTVSRLPPSRVFRAPRYLGSDSDYDFSVQLTNHCVPNLSTSEPK